MKDIKTLVLTFADRLQAVIETDIIDRARAAVMTAMGTAGPKKPGRPPKVVKLSAAKVSVVATKRRKAPLQLCPVPGCKSAAAPVFGMVCAKHKDLPKATIRKYREARRLKKLKADGKAATKKGATKPKGIRRTILQKDAGSSAAKKAAAQPPRTTKAPAKKRNAVTVPFEAATSPAPTERAA